MRLTIPGYILLGLLAIVIIYLVFIARVIILTTSIDKENRNSNSHETITVSVPKQAHVGEEIEVIVYNYPRFFKSAGLSQIVFYDSTGAHSYKDSLSLAEIVSDKRVYSHKLGFFPEYKLFTYKIPQQVCPERIVYETCELVSTKTGKGSIVLLHEPIQSDFFGGEDYQGDGEKIEVSIDIKN